MNCSSVFRESGAVVPGHRLLEVANAFQSAIRRKRVDAAYRDSSLAELSYFDIATDLDTNAHISGRDGATRRSSRVDHL